jgi:trehalose 6-phosphate phosphatase
LGKIADHADLELVRGKRSMELAPPGPRKGGAVERLVRDAGARGVLYAGDDLPDLEAFHALDRLEAQGVKTVKVAVQGAETPRELVAAADLIVEGPAGMAALLRLL